MSNRLATINPDRRSGLRIVLDHLKDRSHGDAYTTARKPGGTPDQQIEQPTEYGTALEMLANTTFGATQLADALTGIARDDNLDVDVTEKSIRDYRKKIR